MFNKKLHDYNCVILRLEANEQSMSSKRILQTTFAEKTMRFIHGGSISYLSTSSKQKTYYQEVYFEEYRELNFWFLIDDRLLRKNLFLIVISFQKGGVIDQSFIRNTKQSSNLDLVSILSIISFDTLGTVLQAKSSPSLIQKYQLDPISGFEGITEQLSSDHSASLRIGTVSSRSLRNSGNSTSAQWKELASATESRRSTKAGELGNFCLRNLSKILIPISKAVTKFR